MMMWFVVLLACAVLAAVVVVRRSRPSSGFEFERSTPRVSATVGTGGEQIVMHLARVLGIARNLDEADYGHIYIADSSESGIVFATRSEIGRGFAADLTVSRAEHGSKVDYTVRSLPGDEAVAAEVATLEHSIADALKSLDPRAEIQMPAQSANRAQRR